MRECQIQPVRVVMLEARDVCSGATGRNGGHITPVLYPHYQWLKEEYGAEVAKEIIRFRLKHLPELLKVAAEEDLLEESQCREVEYFDVFHDKGLYSEAKELLSEYQKDLPLEGSRYKIHEGEETIERLQLSSKTVGCLSTLGGAIHPYRLVTGILERLLEEYPQSFHLFSHTPCTAIKTCRDGLYEVLTPKGAIKTRHVVHATNAGASHLLPGMRERIVPLREAMTAQKPREGLGSSPGENKKPWTGDRSFVFYPRQSLFDFDYLTQQRMVDDEKAAWPAPQGELMLGSNTKNIEDIGNVDDREWSRESESYLQQALGEYFEVKSKDKEEVKGVWSGIIGTSSDGMPWVGRVPEMISGRRVSRASDKGGMAAAGEWLAAGYSGEGMVHAWLSGKTVAQLVLGLPGSELPGAFRIGESRWSRTGVEEGMVRMVMRQTRVNI
ncbi:FAD dependent oxidoreductase [Amanita muscaria]